MVEHIEKVLFKRSTAQSPVKSLQVPKPTATLRAVVLQEFQVHFWGGGNELSFLLEFLSSITSVTIKGRRESSQNDSAQLGHSLPSIVTEETKQEHPR